ncbi:STAS domain-containing protein [Streptomyces mesophilus]|uniref:STAS domain-containing protein n=1 Tax=Streptomyces mesophilus TaxID=1775132 RepID=UPI00332EAD53
MCAAESTFALYEHRAGTTTVIRLCGEIDIHAALVLGPRAEQLTGELPDVLVDLSAVTFLDVGGLRLLARMRDRAQDRGLELRFVRGTAQVMRVFRMTRQDSSYTFVDRLPPGQGEDEDRPPGLVTVP